VGALESTAFGGGETAHKQTALVNRPNTALLITVLLHGLYVRVIPIGLQHWHDQMLVGSHWHDQVLIGFNWIGFFTS
jgi:hypothetical protein